MKPITLILKNFGPYKNETIDFTTFYQTPLFLITGKTGSGKTTIFDGMSFALYGETTGGLRQGKEMRSNFAEATEETSVTFNFEHQGKIYEVERKPEQVLQKKRGEGTRSQAAKVCLTVFDEQEKEIKQLTKQGEVKSFVEELLHLDVHQFTQIVLLPQGDFRKFLNANSAEKEKVLRKLFATDIYGQLAERLKERKKQYNQQLEKEMASIHMLSEQLIWDEEYLEKVSETTSIQDVLQLLTQQTKVYENEQNSVEKEGQELRKQKQKIEQQLARKQQIIQYYEELFLVEKNLHTLWEEKENIEGKEQQVNRLKWVEQQENLLLRYQEAQEEVTKLEKTLQESQVEYQNIQEEMETKQKKVQNLLQQKEKMETKEQQVQQLTQMIPLVNQWQELKGTQKTLEQTILEKTKALQSFTDRNEELQVAINKQTELLEQQESLLEQQHEYSTWQLKVEQVIEKVHKGREVHQEQEKQQEQLQQIKKQQEELCQLSQEQEADYKRKKSQWASMQIARLSMELVEGEPCPVCGATTHPAPHFQKAWTLESMKDAEQAVEQAEIAWQKIQKKQVKAEKEQEHIIDASKRLEVEERELENVVQLFLENLAQTTQQEVEEITPESPVFWEKLMIQLEDRMKNYKGKLQEIENQLNRIKQLKVQREEQAAEIKMVQESMKEVEEAEQVLRNDLLIVMGQLEQIKKNIPKEWQERTDLLIEKESLEQEIMVWKESCESLQLAIQQLEKAKIASDTQQQQHRLQLGKYQQVVEKNEISLLKNIKDANIDYTIAEMYMELEKIAQIESLQKDIEKYQKQQLAYKVRMEDLQGKIANQPCPEIVEEKQQILEIENQVVQIEKNYARISQMIFSNEKYSSEIVSKQAGLEKQWQEVAAINQLSEVANGDGPYNKKSLERFVLQAYFEEVLKVANQRFMQLTNNRYSFELNQTQGSYKSQTGLEINVYDDEAGAVRSVNTLSGGESFIAALSLSLSLAEVVQSQTGGVQIDAMFIDEGFGSLDEDSLEVAMEALEMIEGKGKMIGIISHVKELKQRIPQQLQVMAMNMGQSQICYQTELE